MRVLRAPFVAKRFEGDAHFAVSLSRCANSSWRRCFRRFTRVVTLPGEMPEHFGDLLGRMPVEVQQDQRAVQLVESVDESAQHAHVVARGAEQRILGAGSWRARRWERVAQAPPSPRKREIATFIATRYAQVANFTRPSNAGTIARARSPSPGRGRAIVAVAAIAVRDLVQDRAMLVQQREETSLFGRVHAALFAGDGEISHAAGGNQLFGGILSVPAAFAAATSSANSLPLL